MTEKRFTLTFDDKIVDNLTGIIHDVHSGYDVAMDLSELLNDLVDENEQLKSEKKDMQILINTISDQRNEFHRGARENANRVGKLEKENEQLKQDGFYWSQTAEARRKEIDKLRKDNTILKQQRDYLFDVIDEVLPHSGSTTAYNRMKDIGDVE